MNTNKITPSLIMDYARVQRELEKCQEKLHYCEGTSNLAIKHRDMAEAELKRLRGIVEKCQQELEESNRLLSCDAKQILEMGEMLDTLISIFVDCKWDDCGPLENFRPEDEKYITKESLMGVLRKKGGIIKFKSLEDLTEEEFNTLKSMGYLWEFYPEAPEFYWQIKMGAEDQTP